VANLAITETTLALAQVDPLTAQQVAAFPALPSNAAQIIAAMQAANCPLTQVQINALDASITGVLNDTPMPLALVQLTLSNAGVSTLTAQQIAVLNVTGFPLTIAEIVAALITGSLPLTNSQVWALNA
jgi:hypothetical protein